MEDENVIEKKILYTNPRQELILDYSLVLSSQAIKHWIEFDGLQFSLLLEPEDFEAAEKCIEVYRNENVGYQIASVDAGKIDLTLSPLLFLTLPTAFYFLVGTQPWANWWHSRGSADAKEILAGEWWRCFTATTLHADDLHLLSNLVSGYFILNLLNHRIGIGTVMLLTTLGAAAANYFVAVASQTNHISIGFSSVVFTALGLLAGLQTRKLPREKDFSLRTLTPLISAFFIAVLVGLGEKVDVKAHFFGFGIGALLGLAVPLLPKKSAQPAWQAGLVLVVIGINILTWFLALHH